MVRERFPNAPQGLFSDEPVTRDLQVEVVSAMLFTLTHTYGVQEAQLFSPCAPSPRAATW